MTKKDNFGKEVLADLMWAVTPITAPIGLLNFTKDYLVHSISSNDVDVEKYFEKEKERKKPDNPKKEVPDKAKNKEKKTNINQKNQTNEIIMLVLLVLLVVIALYVIYKIKR